MKGRRLLDLCCGAGLAAWGYWLSGRFSEIVGIDSDSSHQRRYAFDFIHGDALAVDYEFLWQFDFIHASPPCQGYSNMTPDKSIHPRLIRPFRQMLHAAGVPHAVENVPGAVKELRPNLGVSGVAFGLPSARPRYFYVSTLAAPLRLMKMRTSIDDQTMSDSPGAQQLSFWPDFQEVSHVAGAHYEKMTSSSSSHLIVDGLSNVGGRPLINVHGDNPPRADVIQALGLDVIPSRQLAKISVTAMEQGIPPVFTRFIAELAFSEKVMIA